MKLTDFLSMLQNLLEGTGFQGKTFLVGGVVRDHLLGESDFYDFDLAIRMKFGGLKLGAYMMHRLDPISYETFPKFGTARMELETIKLDFVETRKERYQPGRRYPKIRFGSIEDDVSRRDFTVNALYMDVFTRAILDPSGMGIEDLEQGIIRTLRDPDKVISEDYLRILRAVRFAAKLEFDLDVHTRQAIIKHAPMIGRLSQTAISREVDKMKASKAWNQAQILMQDLGLGSICADYS